MEAKLSDQDTVHQTWLPVIGRALAVLCLHFSNMGEKSLKEKASFLEGLGIERKAVAAMLGTTYGSITETLSKAKRNQKGKAANAKKPTKRKPR